MQSLLALLILKMPSLSIWTKIKELYVVFEIQIHSFGAKIRRLRNFNLSAEFLRWLKNSFSRCFLMPKDLLCVIQLPASWIKKDWPTLLGIQGYYFAKLILHYLCTVFVTLCVLHDSRLAKHCAIGWFNFFTSTHRANTMSAMINCVC